jgi:hypothetical protein
LKKTVNALQMVGGKLSRDGLEHWLQMICKRLPKVGKPSAKVYMVGHWLAVTFVN